MTDAALSGIIRGILSVAQQSLSSHASVGRGPHACARVRLCVMFVFVVCARASMGVSDMGLLGLLFFHLYYELCC